MGRRSDRIAHHVNAIQVLMRRNVLCVVVQAEDGMVSVITPSETRFQVLDTLAHTDWRTTYNQMCEQQDRM